jgi:hypothetical protein
MPFKAVSIRGHTPLHTAFRPSKHPLKSFCCASAYSNRAVCFVNRREQTEGVAGSFVQLYKQFDIFWLFSLFTYQHHDKLKHLKKSLKMITRPNVNLTERGLATDWAEGSSRSTINLNYCI